MTYALDSNIISYWLQRNFLVRSRLFQVASRGHTIVIPPTTYYELLRGFKHKEAPGKEYSFRLMCRTYVVGNIDLDVWEKAAHIYAATRKIGKPIEDNDILIAAFCIVNGYTLVTNNVRHFENIDGLEVENWAEE